MKQLTCELCNSTDFAKQDGFFVCQSCGMKYSVEDARRLMVEGTVVENVEKRLQRVTRLFGVLKK